MFYEAFFPDPANQFDWVRNARSLPYLQSAGTSFRTILVKVVPASLTEPKGEQQGMAPVNTLRICLTTGHGQCHEIVIYPAQSTRAV
jgi:hypothetical protein